MEYLILTEQRIVKGADRISVTFSDTAVAEAQVKAYDGNTGLAVLCVNKKDLEESTKKVISIAELGNSNLVKKGAPIIAAGSPMEYDLSLIHIWRHLRGSVGDGGGFRRGAGDRSESYPHPTGDGGTV